MGLSILEGLAKAFSMILVSEIGDKTFFLAAVMAMRHPRRWVCAGSLAALWTMTVVSASLGWAAPNLLPRRWTHALATLLFFFFGARSLWEGIAMGDSHARAEEELREVEAQLDESDKKRGRSHKEPLLQNGHANGDEGLHLVKDGSTAAVPQALSPKLNGVASTVSRRSVQLARGASRPGPPQPAAGAQLRPNAGHATRALISPVFFQAFSLLFFGEWGDKSQISTIGLASEENVLGVALGGCLGHAICNGAAVLGGRHLASMISERMVAIFGGLLFLAFAVHSLLHGSAA